MSDGGTENQVEAIRSVIAVDPTRRRTPSEFQRTPLPNPNHPPATAHAIDEGREAPPGAAQPNTLLTQVDGGRMDLTNDGM